jgi:hypothetical protein
MPVDWRQPIREPLTPVQIEERLRQSISLLADAQFHLRAARDAETEAEIAYNRAKYAATLSREAPVVERGGSTVGERDAWVAQQSVGEWAAWRRAQTTREAAQDHLRTVRDIVEVLRSLGASVRTAYEGAGWSGGK